MPCARLPLKPVSTWTGVYKCTSKDFFGACAQQACTFDTSSAVAINAVALETNNAD